ncbi:MAG: ATP-binding cassette domain-containing protein [Tissierellia bacterium]|jgi:ABC-2 type transport system ATP-binding protein|nr:ATP-binding cassette domain-containing protein [Tissierellia bacterium]
MIEVVKLNKSFGKHHVLKDISFKVSKGEIVGFIGPNGSGKSTTMKCLVNLIFPDIGKITIDEYDLLNKRKEALSLVNALIEAPGLYPNLTGLDNLKLFGELKKVKKERIEQVMEIIQLDKEIYKKVREYSMGMKQRLALGIILLSKPKYLILDEPFNGLDPQGVFDLRKVLLSLAEAGHGLMVSSHQLLELEKITTRNIFIKSGEIVHREALSNSSSLIYKILFEDGILPSENFIKELIENDYILKYELEDHLHLFHIPVDKNISDLLKKLLDNHLNVKLLMPIDDIESLYQSIYS